VRAALGGSPEAAHQHSGGKGQALKSGASGKGEELRAFKPVTDCSLAGGLLVLKATLGGLLEAADMALNSSGEASVIGSKAQDRCCIARALWAKVIVHETSRFPRKFCKLA